MSQKTRILELLKADPNRLVSCRTLANEFLFHKAASRISELKKDGYNVRYIPSITDSPLDAYYELVSEPIPIVWENGQARFVA